MMSLSPSQKHAVQAEPETCIDANVQLLQKLSQTIVSLTTEQFTWQYNNVTSSIGKHARHIIDHYTCFFRHLAVDYINYDDRPRINSIETTPHIAYEELSKVVSHFGSFDAYRTNPVYVYISATPDEEAAPVESSLHRELLFLQSHTLHHMAVVQLLLNILGVTVDPEFAFAPSTTKYGYRL